MVLCTTMVELVYGKMGSLCRIQIKIAFFPRVELNEGKHIGLVPSVPAFKLLEDIVVQEQGCWSKNGRVQFSTFSCYAVSLSESMYLKFARWSTSSYPVLSRTSTCNNNT